MWTTGKAILLTTMVAAYLASAGLCNAAASGAGTSASAASHQQQQEWLDAPRLSSWAAAAGRRALLAASGVKGAPVKVCSTTSDCTPTDQPCMLNMCVDGRCKLVSKSDVSREYGGCVDGDPLTSDKCNPSAVHGAGCETPKTPNCQTLTFALVLTGTASNIFDSDHCSFAYAGLIFGERAPVTGPGQTAKDAADSGAQIQWYDAADGVPVPAPTKFTQYFSADCTDGSSPLCPDGAGIRAAAHNIAEDGDPSLGQIRFSAQDGVTPWDLYSVQVMMYSELANYANNKGKPVPPDSDTAAVMYEANAYDAAGALITTVTFNPAGGILESTYMLWVLNLKGIITLTIDVLNYYEGGFHGLFLDSMRGCFPDPTMLEPLPNCVSRLTCGPNVP